VLDAPNEVSVHREVKDWFEESDKDITEEFDDGD